MSVPVLIGFAGVLVAAAATGMLAGRCVRQPGPGFAALAVAALGLTVALAVQSLGFASGFGPATFRAVQLFALLVAPLGLAWGLAELTWSNDAARFGARLGAAALTVVGGVILATDPLTGQPFSKAWPLPGVHDDAIAHYVLDVVQVVTIVVAVVSVALAARGRDARPRGGALLGAGSVGAAVLLTAALRLSLPDRSLYPLLTLVAAALVWFGTTRITGRPGRGRIDRGRRPAGVPAGTASGGRRTRTTCARPGTAACTPAWTPGSAIRVTFVIRGLRVPGADPVRLMSGARGPSPGGGCRRRSGRRTGTPRNRPAFRLPCRRAWRPRLRWTMYRTRSRPERQARRRAGRTAGS